jgi:ribosomal-protein-alanine N-acetyltransferase
MARLTPAPPVGRAATMAAGGREVAPTTFTLRRVFAERLAAAHLPALRRMDGNARMMAPLGGVRSPAQTEAGLQRQLGHWSEHGFGTWLLTDPVTGQVMGRAGLRHLDVEGLAEVELACALLPEFWGAGLGTEVARACVTIGLEWLGLPSLVALARPDSVAAHRVLLKSAFTAEREVQHGGRPHILFRTD